jgi:hypothetical protein
VIDIIFGEHVELGGFLMVIAIVITLMVSREVINRIYVALGEPNAADAA